MDKQIGKEANDSLAFYNKYTNLSYYALVAGGILMSVCTFKIEQVALFEEATNITLQSVAILLMLAIIPLSLKYYKAKYELIKDKEDDEIIAPLMRIYTIRICVNILLLLVLNLVYLLTNDQSLLYCELIVMVVILFFCRPVKLLPNEPEASIADDENGEEDCK